MVTGAMVKFDGQELPVGYVRASHTMVRKDEFPELYLSLKGNAYETDTHFRLPSGDDLYVLGEVPTNKMWISGQRIFRYGIEITAFPNTTTSTVALPFEYNEITSVFGMANSGTTHLTVPNSDNAASTASINAWVAGTDFKLRTNWDASGYSGYLFIEYTKGTDRNTAGSHIINIGDTYGS